MATRLVRKLTEVADEVRTQLQAHYNVTHKELEAWSRRAQQSPYQFPESTQLKIEQLHIDYEVQRDVIHKHIINIMKKWDPRICSPVSACQLEHSDRIDAYDGQHRTIAATILGFESIPGAVVHTEDANFASYAFEMLNDTGVKRLMPADLHRNALVRYKNGSREIKNVRARTMQDQFDALEIDLQDKNSRRNDNLRGEHDYFFSHFKYAQKAIELDESGQVLHRMLSAIKTAFPLQEEIDQGVFIGLYELQRLIGIRCLKFPEDWMEQLLKSIRPLFKSSSLLHSKAKVQWQHVFPGATWDAPRAMCNFLRELYIYSQEHALSPGLDTVQGLPYHGDGSTVGILEGNVSPELVLGATA
jgi:hypothetical protein